MILLRFCTFAPQARDKNNCKIKIHEHRIYIFSVIVSDGRLENGGYEYEAEAILESNPKSKEVDKAT